MRRPGGWCRDPPNPYAHGCIDRIAVEAHGVGSRVAGGDQEQLVRAIEGGRQGVRLGVVAIPHSHPEVGEALSLGDVTCDDDDLACRTVFQQVFDGGAVEGAGGPGHDDHGQPLIYRENRAERSTGVISGISLRFPSG